MIFNHVKFFSYYIFSIAGIISVLAGEYWITIGYFCFQGFFIIGDAFFGDDLSTPDYPYEKLLKLSLWLALPMSILTVLSGVWLTSEAINWSFMTALSHWSGYDLLTAKAQTSNLEIVIAGLFCGLMLGGVGTISAHELVHRVGDKVSLCVGRWILALSFDSNFSIEHVYGHHLYVATEQDPATAPRGRSVYKHIILSIWNGNISAWNIEKKRLQRKNQSLVSWYNICLRGYMMSIVWLVSVFVLAGLPGLSFAVFAGLIAKTMLELVNYMEHYGIVRLPTQRVMPKHSWNTNRRISCWTMFNLSRHSHHHAQGGVPFQKLQPMREAPTMINGYTVTMLVTLIPPLWYKLMDQKLADWDKNYASSDELKLLQKQLQTKNPGISAAPPSETA